MYRATWRFQMQNAVCIMQCTCTVHVGHLAQPEPVRKGLVPDLVRADVLLVRKVADRRGPRLLCLRHDPRALARVEDGRLGESHRALARGVERAPRAVRRPRRAREGAEAVLAWIVRRLVALARPCQNLAGLLHLRAGADAPHLAQRTDKRVAARSSSALCDARFQHHPGLRILFHLSTAAGQEQPWLGATAQLCRGAQGLPCLLDQGLLDRAGRLCAKATWGGSGPSSRSGLLLLLLGLLLSQHRAHRMSRYRCWHS